MRLLEELFGDLAEVVDEADGGVPLEGILDGEDVNVSLVEEVVEDVDGVGGGGALLLPAEDQVDPLVQVGRHVLALKRLPVQIQQV